MADVRFGDRCARRHLFHLENPSARGIHFDVQLAIGGTGVQAQAAVDALVEIGLARGVGIGRSSEMFTSGCPRLEVAMQAPPVEKIFGIEHPLHSSSSSQRRRERYAGGFDA